MSMRSPDQIQRLAREVTPDALPSAFTAAQRTQLQTRLVLMEDPTLLAALDAGTATSLQIQAAIAVMLRVQARICRALLRL